MRLFNTSKYNPLIQDTVSIGQIVEILDPASYPVKAVIAFQEHNENREVRCYKQTVVFFNNNYNNLADRIKKVSIGDYIVVQLSNRKNNNVVCVNFCKKNHYMKVMIDEQKFIWVFFGNPGKISFVKKDIKGEEKDALQFFIPTKGKDGNPVINRISMLENDKYPRIQKASEILLNNSLVAVVCSGPYNNEFSCFKIGLPDTLREKLGIVTSVETQKEALQPNNTNPGDVIINLGFAEGQNKTIRMLWEENHKQFIKFVAYEWVPYSNQVEELAAYKKIQESCKRFLESINVA